ncbi:MAG: hypothetical protein GY792_34170 [Gammaproteobacteria bacterium]|nr:hypothetical protein [Gammaproteobacteria bacterium]
MALDRSAETLHNLFISETVVDLPRIRAALGNASPMTAFRYLRQLPYLHSYNHNGSYYCLYEPARHDRLGIWSVGDIHFSVDKTLGKTVWRLVCEAPTGATHGELQEWLGVRVHNTLLTLLRRGEVEREPCMRQYLYLHSDADIRQQQIQRRQALIDAKDAEQQNKEPPTDDTVIAVLLTLLSHPEAKAAEVVRYLRGHSPPISMRQVEAIFARYDLDHIGKKGGGSIS